MDEDDDAYLYGEPSPPPISAVVHESEIKPNIKQEQNVSQSVGPSGLSASMAASLAAYGIDPSTSTDRETYEDGLVEEDDVDEEDSDEDEDEDDVKLVFTGAGTRLDLRKPQQQQSNVIGIGKWAHTSTGVAPQASGPSQAGAVQTPVPSIPNQTTEYNPQSRPAAAPINEMANPPISSTTEQLVSTAPAVPQANGTQQVGAPLIHLPPSSLPPAIAPGSHPKIDPTHPTGIIPSTGQTVYEIDLNQFETSGQPWRRPGSDLSDWFNFGFDEISFPKFLRFRAEMEAGRQALMNPLGPMPNNLPSLLHLDMSIPNTNMENMNRQSQGQLPNPGMGMNPQMMGMGMPQGMDGMLGGPGGMGLQGQIGQNMSRQGPRQTATPVPPTTTSEAGEEIKQEEPADGDQITGVDGNVPMPMQGQSGPRGRGMAVPIRGMPTRGVALRGRGAVPVPVGPRAGQQVGSNIPTGPKAGRFKDKDRVEQTPSANSGLDYGGDSRDSSTSRTSSPVKRSSSSRQKRDKSYSYSDDYDSRSERGRSYSRSRSPSGNEREQDKPRGKDRDRGLDRDRVGERDTDKDRDRGREKDNRKDRTETRDRSSSRSPSPVKEDRDRRSSSRKESERSGGRSISGAAVKGEKRKRQRERDEGGSSSAILGPGGWESEGEEQRRDSRSSRNAGEDSKRSRKRR